MSRNVELLVSMLRAVVVTSREGCVSRNSRNGNVTTRTIDVTSREGCVSRNSYSPFKNAVAFGHIPRGMCE